MSDMQDSSRYTLRDPYNQSSYRNRCGSEAYSRYAYQSGRNNPQSERARRSTRRAPQTTKRAPALHKASPIRSLLSSSPSSSLRSSPRSSHGSSRGSSPSSSLGSLLSSFRGRAIALSSLLVVLIFFVVWFGFIPNSPTTPLARALQGDASSNVSTPQSEWTKGTVPALYQTDSKWASVRYNESETLGESGCGPTCLSMVYIALTGKTDYDPIAMFQFAHEKGFMSAAGVQWIFFTEGARQLGLTGEELTSDEGIIREKLESGNPIICSMGPGDFTTSGHLIVLVGIDQNDKLIVQDPNSPERSSQHWDFQTILSQCRNLWSFSA